MEIQFQQPNEHFVIQTKKNNKKGKARNKKNDSKRFVGVRQRPSGRWVAEIKDTTQKIRMWLGTFETAEQAARAYDEAACLLRGSNTRTNFITHVSSDSPLASRIQNLLNNKNKRSKQQQQQDQEVASNKKPATMKVNTTSFIISESNSSSSQDNDTERLFENVYKPDMSVLEELSSGCSSSSSQPNLSWGIGEVMDLSKNNNEVVVSEFSSEFERMKVERQISASLYAINGVQEYMDTVHDPAEAFWDLPPLCSLLC